MKIKPLGNRVVLKQLEAIKSTNSGIILPNQSQEKPLEAEIVAVGLGALINGQRVPMETKVGDKVIYSKFAGTEIKVDDKEYIVISEDEILAIIN